MSLPHNTGVIVQRRFFYYLRRFWWLPILTTVLVAGIVVWRSQSEPTKYSSSSSMWISGQLQIPEGTLYREDTSFFYGNQIALMTSPKIIELAHARVKEAHPELERPMIDYRVIQQRSTAVFLLQATSEEPGYLQPFLNALMEEYLSTKRKLRAGTSGEAIALVNEQVSQQDRELRLEQEKVDSYTVTNNEVVLQVQASIDGNYLAKLKTQLADIRLEDQYLELALSNQVATGKMPGSPTTLSTNLFSSQYGKSGPDELSSALLAIQLLKLERTELGKSLRPKHPKMQKLDEDIDRKQKMVEAMQSQSKEQVIAMRESMAKRIQNVEEAIKEWEIRVLDTNKKLAEIAKLKANVERARTMQQKMQALSQQLDVGRNLDKESMSVLEPASPPYALPINYKQRLIFAAFGGIGLAAGIFFLMAKFSRKIRDPYELDHLFQTAVIGQIPEIRKLRTAGLINPNNAKEDELIAVESFRNIRSALFSSLEKPEEAKSIMVTSAIPHEGKSLVSANLAMTIALTGSRVLLIDADARRGRLHELLAMKVLPGLGEVLNESATVDEAIRQTACPHLHFLPCGKFDDSLPELLASRKTSLLVETLTQRYDYVIIDTPPILAADDATTLAPKVGGVLFVIRESMTTAEEARTALLQLQQRNAHLLGLIMNGSGPKHSRLYYRKYANYYRGTPIEPPLAEKA